MDAVATPAGLVLDPGFVSLAALPPGTSGRVVGVGNASGGTLGARAPPARVRIRQRRARRDPRGGAPGARSVRGARGSDDARPATSRGAERLGGNLPLRTGPMNAPAAAALAAPQLSLSLIGVPNCGKTALFNRLTGSRQKVANYPGVTVERKEGRLVGPRTGRIFRVVDLPGAYSLEPATLDEAIARDVVLGRHASEPAPDLLICVVDATNLRLNLRLVLDLKRLGRPDDRRTQHERRRRAARLPARPRRARAGARRAGDPHGRRALRRRARTASRRSTPTRFTDATLTQARTRLEPPALANAADIEATQREVRRVLEAAGYRVPARVAALAQARPGGAAPGRRSAAARGGVVPHVPGGLQLGQGAAGLDQCRRAGAERLARRRAAAGPAARPAARWRARRHRQRAGVPAADPHPVCLHPGAGGFRLPAARGLHARSPHGAGRTLRARVHPAAVELRLRHSRHHGGAHHPLQPRPPRDHHDRPAHDLLGAAAGVRAADRRLHSPAQPRRSCNLRGLVLFALYLAGVASALGVAFVLKRTGGRGEYRALLLELPEYRLPHLSQSAARPVGAHQDLPGARRHHHPHPDGGAVVPRELPRAARRRHRACDPVQHRRLPRPRPASTCSRRSASTGRSRSRWCRDSRRAKWR